MKTDIPIVTSLWNWMQDSSVSLGLDLQGGTQLDYEIDLRNARARNEDDDTENDVDISSLLSGVKDVIERRVNSLGVSEPNIYLSSAGDEEHIVVELPGIDDIEKAKNKVGKVVQLEFKTEKPDATPEDIAAIEKQANTLFERITSEESIDDLESYIEDDIVPNQVEYKKEEKVYLDELPEEFQSVLPDVEPGKFVDHLIRAKESARIYNQGQFYQPEGFNIIRLTGIDTELRKKPVNAEDFQTVMDDMNQSSSEDYFSESDILPKELFSALKTLETDEVTDRVDSKDGFYIAKMLDKRTVDDSENPEPEFHSAHILLKTKDEKSLKEEKPLKDIPDDASDEVKKDLQAENDAIEEENKAIRDENKNITAENAKIRADNEDVKAKAEEILVKVKENPDSFADLAKEYSEDSSADKGGDLGYVKPSSFVKPFVDAALALDEGSITQELVKSKFGYHIIKLIDLKPANEERYKYAVIRTCFTGSENCTENIPKEDAQKKADEILKRVRQEKVYSYERVWINAVPEPWANTELDGRYFKRADVAYDQISFRPYVLISFDDEGAKLFEKLTEENVQKRIGIFVGGEFISAPTVNERISGGQAQITLGTPNVKVALQEANDLAQSLNAGSIPAPLKKPNELNIGASLGKDSLQKSIKAGLFGLILVALFMILYYRMMGVLASLSLIVYGLLLTFLIQSNIPPLISISIAFFMWIGFSLKLYWSKIDAFGKVIFLALSVIGLVFIFSVLDNPIVLTLAGVAGLILSVGMAVDANILIFERIKEEFDAGKSFLIAVNDGFERAWSSILDSNVSSLITCGILFYFGTSIIKGFAINLATGIVISMFTAITVTKTFLLFFEGTSLEKVKWLWKRKD